MFLWGRSLQFVSAVDGDIVGGIGGPPGGLVVDVDGDGALEDVEVRLEWHGPRVLMCADVC